MKKYKVPVIYQVWGTVEVEAESYQDLTDKLRSEHFVNTRTPLLADNPEYIYGSYEVDFDNLDEYIEETDEDDLEGEEMEINKEIKCMEIYYKKWYKIDTKVWDDDIEFSYANLVLKPIGRVKDRKETFNIFSNVLYRHIEIPNFSHEGFYAKLKRKTKKEVDLFYCTKGPKEMKGQIVIPNNNGFFTLDDSKVFLMME